MHILPILEYEICSSYSVFETAKRLDRFSDLRYREWWDTPQNDPVTGEALKIQFQFIPTKRYQTKFNRTFEPIVTGTIIKFDGGAKVKISMRIDQQNGCMLYLWLFFCAVGLWQAFVRHFAEPAPGDFFPIVLIIFMGLLFPCAAHFLVRKEAGKLYEVIKKLL